MPPPFDPILDTLSVALWLAILILLWSDLKGGD